MMDWQLKNNIVLIDCGKSVELECIQTQKEILSEALQEYKPIVLLANEINHIDTASLQLLLVFIREATKKNIKVKWQEPSDSLLYSANLIGLKAVLELPEK